LDQVEVLIEAELPEARQLKKLVAEAEAPDEA
jgi:hypothetical protein